MIIVIITVALLVLLFMALFKHSQLETRYYAFINFLERIDKSVVKLDTDWEKILCIFATGFSIYEVWIFLYWLSYISLY